MDKQRILKEAQKLATQFSFWMVSGNIAHLYGFAYEIPEKKYELEIKFDENFPNIPPQFIFHDEIKELLGDFELKKLKNWTPQSNIVDIVLELKNKIQEALETLKMQSSQDLVPASEVSEEKMPNQSEKDQYFESKDISPETEEYITPDLNAYPPDFQIDEFIAPSDELFYDEQQHFDNAYPSPTKPYRKEVDQEPIIEELEPTSVVLNTELGLIQQEYAYDQIDQKNTNINVYITITLTKTFIIQIDFANFPDKPIVSFPEKVREILGDPYQSLETLIKWNSKNPPHIVDILHEIERELHFIKAIEEQSKKILGEYQCDRVAESFTQLNVHLLTYGFKDYIMEIDLQTYPKPPIIDLSSDLEQIVPGPISGLNAYKNWSENESEPVEIIREISWLVDKNSRINFEIDLLGDHYKNIKYDPSTETLRVDMKGKMKTQDITFKFQINLPIEYPMKMPEVKVLNEFELDSHEKIKKDLDSSFTDFFNEWTPFSYLIDLFNLISKKIFEVSVVSCVICHKIECPSCTKRIAGDDDCHSECPHCNRAYHQHCWEQTIKSFGKCGFCLR